MMMMEVTQCVSLTSPPTHYGDIRANLRNRGGFRVIELTLELVVVEH
jgi:hypothetical protein